MELAFLGVNWGPSALRTEGEGYLSKAGVGEVGEWENADVRKILDGPLDKMKFDP